MQSVQLSEFVPADASAVDDLAIAAFEEYKDAYTEWPSFKEKISAMSALAAHGELIVARDRTELVGAVAYIGPHRPKSDLFAIEWSIMRMLVVAPHARGRGIGRALAAECIARAVRDEAAVMALHTSKIMSVALPMYLRMGFELWAAAPPIHGVPYDVYIKQLNR